MTMRRVNQLMLERVDETDGLCGVFVLRCGSDDWIRVPIRIDEGVNDADGRAALWVAFHERFPDFPAWPSDSD